MKDLQISNAIASTLSSMTDNPFKVRRMRTDKLADKVQNKYLQSEEATLEFIQKCSQNQLKKYGKNVKNELSEHNQHSARCKACLIGEREILPALPVPTSTNDKSSYKSRS